MKVLKNGNPANTVITRKCVCGAELEIDCREDISAKDNENFKWKCPCCEKINLLTTADIPEAFLREFAEVQEKLNEKLEDANAFVSVALFTMPFADNHEEVFKKISEVKKMLKMHEKYLTDKQRETLEEGEKIFQEE